MTTKLLDDAQFKATQTSAKTRVLDFYACTFSTIPDKSGDTIDPRALDDWLKAFYAAGKPLPISFAHSAVLDSTDPYNIIGSAPADPSHVWTDDYGLRVKATLNVGSNDTARYVADLIDQGIVTGASIAFTVTKEAKNDDGSARITEMQVKEAGPCLSPANEQAVVLALKAVRDELRGETETKAVDNSAWDGNMAMGMCSSAADYRSICAGEHTVGSPDERQHWALPHHFLGKGPNAGGVQAGLGRVSQTQNLKSATAAQSHLEAHMKEINPDYSPPKSVSINDTTTTTNGTVLVSDFGGATWSADFAELVLKHASSPAHLQAAHDALVRAGAKCATVGEVVKTVESAEREVQDRLRNLRWLEKALV